MMPRVTRLPSWLVITALISASATASLTFTTVPVMVKVSPMKTGLANLHSTPCSRQWLDALVQQFPGRIVTFDADLSSPEAVDALCARFGKDLPCPTHFVHLPALPVVNAKFKAFDEARFQKDWEIQVHSAVKLCKAVLPAMRKAKFGRVLFIQTSYTIGCPPKNTAAYVMAKSAKPMVWKRFASSRMLASQICA